MINNEKVNYLIDIIKDMDIENKLRLAICIWNIIAIQI